jgi:hypothetical protein
MIYDGAHEWAPAACPEFSSLEIKSSFARNLNAVHHRAEELRRSARRVVGAVRPTSAPEVEAVPVAVPLVRCCGASIDFARAWVVLDD